MEICWVASDYKDEGMLEARYIATVLLVGGLDDVTPMALSIKGADNL